MTYVNKNKYDQNTIKAMPFDIDGVSFEKEKTYTNQKTKKFISNIGDDIINNNNDKKINFYDKFVNDKNNNNNNKNIIHINNKSPIFIKNRNKSNIFVNLTNSKNNEKGFETHNEFYSVRNKYKKMALKKENDIKTTPSNMQEELPNKEQYNTKRNSKINISQNISPRIIKRNEEKIKYKIGNDIEDKNKYNIGNGI